MKKLIYILPLLFFAQISMGQQRGTLKTWKVQGGGGGHVDTTSLSNRINSKQDTSVHTNFFFEAPLNGRDTITIDDGDTTNGVISSLNGALKFNPNFAKASNAATYLTTPTYDGSGQAVHPDVWYDADGWNGYKWWMVMTPYPGGVDTYENPSLLCSNDGETWAVPPGITNPIVDLPGGGQHYLDPEIIPPSSSYDGKMRILYGFYNGTSTQFYTRTFDGTTIGDSVSTGFTQPNMVAPCVILRGSTYMMYYVVRGTPNVLKLRTASTPEGPWSDPTICSLNMGVTNEVWHVNSNLVDGNIILIVTSTLKGQNGAGTQLYFASAINDSSFSVSYTPMLNRSDTGWDNDLIYHSSAVFKGDRDFDLYYSAMDSSNIWHIGNTSFTMPSTTVSTVATTGNYTDLAGVFPGTYASLPDKPATIYDSATYTRITNPVGGVYTSIASSSTGAIAITLPYKFNSTMFRMTVKVFDYTDMSSFDVTFGGYTFSTGWVRTFAYIIADPTIDRQLSVRFGSDANHAIVYIGELASTWAYLKVFVTDIEVGSNGLAAWTNGLSIGLEASAFQNVTQTKSNKQIGYGKENSLGNPASNGYVLSSTTAGVRSWIAPPTSGISGTGTSNYIQKSTGTGTIGNSLIYENGLSVGIGTTTSTANLQVTGTGGLDILRLVNSGGNTAFQVDNSTLNAKFWQSSSATAPSISFMTDVNTGIFHPAVGAIGFTNAGVEGMRLASGKLGVGITSPTSTLQSGGSFSAAYISKTTTYTATISDYAIDCTGGGTFTVTLPTAVGITGREYVVTNSGTGTITIATTSSQTFTNVTATPTSLTITSYGTYKVQSTGAAWIVTSKL